MTCFWLLRRKDLREASAAKKPSYSSQIELAGEDGPVLSDGDESGEDGRGEFV